MQIKAVALLALLLTGQTLAADLRVIGVQLPAWVERGNVHQPLTPGMELRASDSVHTGPGARLLLRMGEGSNVKLGENAVLQLDTLGVAQEDKGLFRAALSVLTGAFRFTTDKLLKSNRREITVHVAAVTAGIRGTDLWGRAGSDKDIVCLIEGKIEVAKEGHMPVTMSDPLSFYVAPKDGDPLPVAAVPPEKLQQWAQETEIADGMPVLRAEGRYSVQVAMAGSQQEALAWYDQLRAAGYPAKIRPQGRKHFSVRVPGLSDATGAAALAQRLSSEFKTQASVLHVRA